MPFPDELPAGAEALAIMYHEVIAEGDRSPAPPDAVLYKLDERDFREHVAAIRDAIGIKPAGRADDPEVWRSGPPVFLTFDDGEASACTIVAPLLESHGWRGHYFVTTNDIGKPRFLTPPQIRELHARGHVIGSHSCSHPLRMSSLSRGQMLREWSDSVKALADILGAPVTIASVPGGFYSRKVAETAAEAGIRILFTSEPTMRTRRAAGCLLVGRYFIQRGMGPEVSAAFATGRAGPRWKQALLWKAKKAAKAAAGPLYLRVRGAVLKG